MNAYGAANNKLFNTRPANIAKLLMLTFLGVQAIRQLIQVNEDSRDKEIDGKKLPVAESRAGQISAWMTITMTLLIGIFLYKDVTAIPVLLALFAAAMGSGVALIYDYMTNKTVAHAAERNRMWFGIAHIVFALLTLVYLLMLAIK